MLVLSGYLAFFFCALTTYKMFLLRQYEIDEWSYGFALINALVITKVIMIGQYAKIGRKHESNSVFLSAIWKSFIYGLLVFAFTKLMMTNAPARIDEVQRRPILVLEGAPDGVVVVDSNRVVDPHLARRSTHVLDVVFE